MLPYWPSVTPAMPTTAWAIIPSAGERRGRVGMVGRSYSRRANAAASCDRAVRQAADAGGDARSAGARRAAARRRPRRCGSVPPAVPAGASTVVIAAPLRRPTTRSQRSVRASCLVHGTVVDGSRRRDGTATRSPAGSRRRQIFTPCPTVSRPRSAPRHPWIGRSVTLWGARARVAGRSPSSAAGRSATPSPSAATPCSSWRTVGAWAGWAVGAVALAVPASRR